MRTIVLFIILFTNLVLAQEKSSVHKIGDILFKTLSPFISEKLGTDRNTISYCPDICIKIDFPKNFSSRDRYSFTILLLLQKSNLPEFVDDDYTMPSGLSASKGFRTLVPKILSYYPLCQEIKDLDIRSMVVLKREAKEYDIKAYKTRTDEGYTNHWEIKI